MERAAEPFTPYDAMNEKDRSDDDARRAGWKAALKEQARALGLAELGVTTAEPLPRADQYEAWLAQGRNATMEWLKPGERTNPADLLPGARTMLVAAARYAKPAREPAPIAAYATRDDYHLALKRPLRKLAALLRAFEPGSLTRITVDTAPLREREAAMRAGVGWIGKNTMVVHQQHGCYTLLGTLLWTGELPPDPPAVDQCAECRRCLDACPTQAFPEPWQLDANRCLSYWTIEQREPLPPEMRAAQQGRVFGCDACLAACPYGGRALLAESPLLPTFERQAGMGLLELLLDARGHFWKLFRKTPVERARRHGFLRNLLTAAGDSGNPRLAEAVAPFCHDHDPRVGAAADEALARLRAPRPPERKEPA